MRRTLLLSITGKRNPANVHIACLSGQNRKTFPAHFPNSSAAALAAIAVISLQFLNQNGNNLCSPFERRALTFTQ
jgi:hypothetical protein